MAVKTFNDELKEHGMWLGICVTYPAPGIIERIGSNWDWIWIDMQHGQHDYNSALNCVRACEIANRLSVIRVSSHDYGTIGLALDTGTGGVMVPMINTAEQAMSVVQAAKFPPLGNRSFGGRRVIDLSGRGYADTANASTCLIAQIETTEGLANVNDIASVPGVDVVFFSPDDMALQMGMSMVEAHQYDVFREQMAKVAEAAKKAGKIAGTVTASPEAVALAKDLGYQLCVGASDASLLAGSSAKMRAELQR